MVVPLLPLPSGHDIPVVGYGTGTVWIKESEDQIDRQTVESIKDAIQIGYRHLDGAQYYKTEPELGLAVQESGIDRSQFFVTTKALFSDNLEESLRSSLKKLGMDYVDLYLIHEPFSYQGDESLLQKAWKQMESCVQQGLARAIGVSNFLIPHIETVLKTATIKPAVNQLELHPYLQREDLRAYLRTKGIQATAYAPLTPLTKAKPGPIDEPCERLAKKYGVEDSAILLRWLLDQEIPVITTSSNKTRLTKYLDVATKLKLAADEVNELTAKGKERNYRQFFCEAYGKECFE
ncbi:NADP-dependent oxidoreductase domain-containing protein [Stachybotrys elegans]|uniref:NADP-dependent oxidoreductase domain-containing protein n=1 Tax=Stachybotrys elegans TaxID=80388 RepID=A0A8K0WTY8_9HYPO|nr:NADP-dependent oxidoreductase domain-containing protein [Stachybotrys elegans]